MLSVYDLPDVGWHEPDPLFDGLGALQSKMFQEGGFRKHSGVCDRAPVGTKEFLHLIQTLLKALTLYSAVR